MEKIIVCQRSNQHSNVSGYPLQFWLLLQSQVLRLHVPVSQVAVTGLIAYQSLAGSFSFHKRKYQGVLFLILGTCVMCCHLLFDPLENFPYDPSDWYYMNTYFFLHSIRMYVAMPLFMHGVFFLQPQYSSQKFKNITAFLIYGYCVPMVLMMPFASTNEKFNMLDMIATIFLVVECIVGYFFLYKWMNYIKYHKVDGNEARFSGLVKKEMDSVPDSVWRKMAKETITEHLTLKQTY